MPEKYTGVEGASVAGEQENSFNLFGSDASSQDEDSGAEEPAAAGQEGEEAGGAAGGGGDSSDERVEKAFAKRLAQEKEKIKQELENELRQQMMRQAPPQPEPSLEEKAQKMAEELMITPEAARIILAQEEKVKELATRFYMMQDTSEKVKAEMEINERRKASPYLPPFDEKKLMDIRLQHYNRYGIMPTWEDAYNYHVAEELKAENFGRMVEQQAIQKITKRDKVNVQVGRAEQPQKRNVWDLSDEEFEKLKEKAKRGELKKL